MNKLQDSLTAILFTGTCFFFGPCQDWQSGGRVAFSGSLAAFFDHYVTQNITDNKVVQYVTTSITAALLGIALGYVENPFADSLHSKQPFDLTPIPLFVWAIPNALVLKNTWDSENNHNDITSPIAIDNNNELNDNVNLLDAHLIEAHSTL